RLRRAALALRAALSGRGGAELPDGAQARVALLHALEEYHGRLAVPLPQRNQLLVRLRAGPGPGGLEVRETGDDDVLVTVALEELRGAAVADPATGVGVHRGLDRLRVLEELLGDADIVEHRARISGGDRRRRLCGHGASFRQWPRVCSRAVVPSTLPHRRSPSHDGGAEEPMTAVLADGASDSGPVPTPVQARARTRAQVSVRVPASGRIPSAVPAVVPCQSRPRHHGGMLKPTAIVSGASSHSGESSAISGGAASTARGRERMSTSTACTSSRRSAPRSREAQAT